jgi:hypothetical protein
MSFVLLVVTTKLKMVEKTNALSNVGSNHKT